MRTLISIVLGAFFAAGAAAEDPQWLKDARGREAKLQRDKKLEAPDDWFATRAPLKAAGKVTQDEDGDYSVSFDLGIPSQIECVVFRESSDPPALLKRSSADTLALLATHQGEIEAKAIDRVDARAIGDAIALEVSWFYRVKTAGGPMLGELTLAYAIKQGAGIYCVKTEIGFTRTFRALFDAFVANFERSHPPAQPRYEEILIARLGGKSVGIGHFTLRIDEDGDKKDEQTLHMLVPATSDTLNATTNVGIEWTRGADLTLINAAQVQANGGELTTELRLKWSSEKKRWGVEGTLSGKTLAAELPKNAKPASNLEVLRDLKNALAGPDAIGRKLTWTKWTDASPTQLVETTSSIDELLSDGRVLTTQTIGPVVATAIVERKTGQTVSMTLPAGPTELTLERVFVRGEP